MKGQKLTLATLLVIVIGVIAVALLTIGIWFGYRSVAAKYGWHPPSGPNFGNLKLDPYVVEFSGIESKTYPECLQLVDQGKVDKGDFASSSDYCHYYCPFGCYLVNLTVYSYLYNKEQDVIVSLYANTNVKKVFMGLQQVHLDPWNGNTIDGKSTTKANAIFLVPTYPNNCELNGFVVDATNGEYKNETTENFEGDCVLCGCLPGLNCDEVPCCPYLANFSESTIEMLDEVVCNTSNNHCTTCQALCESAGFKDGECINGETSFSKGRCAPTSETDYPDESKWDNCICYDFTECEGTCKESCSEGEIGYYTKDCSSQGKFCCISYGGGGGGGAGCDPTAKPKCDTETTPCCINGNWQCVTYCPT